MPYLAFEDGSFVRIFDNAHFQWAYCDGFSCSTADFERIINVSFTDAYMGIERDMYGDPVCADWTFTHTAIFSYRWNFDSNEWHDPMDVDSLSLLTVRDGFCYFELDANLGRHLPEGTCIPIDREWRVPLGSLINILDSSNQVEQHLRHNIATLRASNIELRNRQLPQQHAFVEPSKGECPICLESTECMFTCGHHCCKQCFEQLKRNNNVRCPICRQVIHFEAPNFSG